MVEVIITGQLLASLIDEATRGRSRGLLFGTELSRQYINISDSQDEVSTLQLAMRIVNYVAINLTPSFWTNNKINIPFIDKVCHSNTLSKHHCILGSFSIVNTGILYPSFRDVELLKTLRQKDNLPKIVIIINIPKSTVPSSWIFGGQYQSYLLPRDSNQLVSVSITVPSLTRELQTDLRDVSCHHNVNDSTMALYQGLADNAASGLQSCVTTEDLADELLRTIKKAYKETLELEAEVAMLRELQTASK